MLAHQQKHRLLRRLLQQFQQLVRATHIHLLRLPYHHHLIPVPKGFQTQFAHYLAALFLVYHPLLRLHTHPLVPVLQVEVRRFLQLLTKLRVEIIAHITPRPFHNREREMQIRMLQVLILQAGRAHPARVFPRAVRTVQVLRIGYRQRQLTHPLRTAKQLRMRHAPLCHRLTKPLLHILMSYDVLKLHICSNAQNRRKVTKKNPHIQIFFFILLENIGCAIKTLRSAIGVSVSNALLGWAS